MKDPPDPYDCSVERLSGFVGSHIPGRPTSSHDNHKDVEDPPSRRILQILMTTVCKGRPAWDLRSGISDRGCETGAWDPRKLDRPTFSHCSHKDLQNSGG